MKITIIIPAIFILFNFPACSQNPVQQQNKKTNTYENVGGGCEGCEGIYESTVPFEKLGTMCWLPDWNESGGTRLGVNGVVYKPDGKPAEGVVIYIYHTDQTGHYSTKGNEKGWGKRHGYIRGWMKTNEKGEYKFFTRRPIAYPGAKIPAHIHVSIKEPDKNVYWIDDYVFDDDPLLTDEERKKLENRGGSGILLFRDYYKGKEMMKSERHIYLGRNITAYPTAAAIRANIPVPGSYTAFEPAYPFGWETIF